MSEILELEYPIFGERLRESGEIQSVDAGIDVQFMKIAEVTGRYFSEEFVHDVSSITWRVKKDRVPAASWKGW